jgi:hypothetical protein
MRCHAGLNRHRVLDTSEKVGRTGKTQREQSQACAVLSLPTGSDDLAAAGGELVGLTRSFRLRGTQARVRMGLPRPIGIGDGRWAPHQLKWLQATWNGRASSLHFGLEVPEGAVTAPRPAAVAKARAVTASVGVSGFYGNRQVCPQRMVPNLPSVGGLRGDTVHSPWKYLGR